MSTNTTHTTAAVVARSQTQSQIRSEGAPGALPDESLRERLSNPDAMLSRTDLRVLGLERRAVDAVFRSCPVIALPGYSRPLIRVSDYQALLEESTYRNDRVRAA